MQAFGQSFLQPDIHLFKQNLFYLETLNTKQKLYHKVGLSFYQWAGAVLKLGAVPSKGRLKARAFQSKGAGNGFVIVEGCLSGFHVSCKLKVRIWGLFTASFAVVVVKMLLVKVKVPDCVLLSPCRRSFGQPCCSSL